MCVHFNTFPRLCNTCIVISLTKQNIKGKLRTVLTTLYQLGIHIILVCLRYVYQVYAVLRNIC
jgi:hypothetical protein